MKDIARKNALTILNNIDETRRPLDAVMNDILPKSVRIDKRDRALTQTIVFGVLRWRGRIDWIIDHFSNIKMHRIDPRIMNILRMGLFQILFLDRVPVSAAVNTSVELSKTVAEPYVVKFVNAILRKAGSNHQKVAFPGFDQDPVMSIAAAMSFPKWLVQRWLERFGPDACRKLCTFINTIPPITIRTNRLKTNRESLLKSLENDTESVTPTPASPDGISFFNPKLPIEKITSYQKGWFQVQDEAAQLVSLLLDPKPGEKIMDACAGLGGKTGHIAQLMENSGKIIAVDKSRQKLAQLRSAMMHLGISNVTTRSMDLGLPIPDPPAATFDRILLDAPCSGLGVLRRNPDAKWVSEKSNLAHFKENQTALLNHLAPLLKVNGILLYTVCSMEPDENETVVETFLKTHPDYALLEERVDIQDSVKPFIDPNGFFRTLPHLHNMDGFFAARLKRIA